MFSSKVNDFTLFHQRNIVLLLFSLLFLICVGFLKCSELFFGNQVRPLHWCSMLLHSNEESYFPLDLILTGIFVNVFKSFSQLTLLDLFTWPTWAKVYNRDTVEGVEVGWLQTQSRGIFAQTLKSWLTENQVHGTLAFPQGFFGK